MEPIIVIVGFLGAGKTTLLKKLAEDTVKKNWQPYILLNDYENASLDAQQFMDLVDPELVSALSGSCICCSGLPELRRQVNSIPKRDNPITFIEANGTTDACALLGFLGVGLKSSFSPPIQISVVDTRNWQRREFHNELEANQIQVSSLIVLNHSESVSPERLETVKQGIAEFNPFAKIVQWDDVTTDLINSLKPSESKHQPMKHGATHWSSCSVDLDDPTSSAHILNIIKDLPKGIMRVKACTRLDKDEHYSFIEKIPSGETTVKPYRGTLVSGPKLLTIGPGSDPEFLKELVRSSSKFAE